MVDSTARRARAARNAAREQIAQQRQKQQPSLPPYAQSQPLVQSQARLPQRHPQPQPQEHRTYHEEGAELVGRQALLKHKNKGGLKRFDSGDYFLEQEQQKKQAQQFRGGQRGSCCASSGSLSPAKGSVVGPRTSSCFATAGYDRITNTNMHGSLKQRQQQQGKVTKSTHDQIVRRACTVDRYGNYRQMIDFLSV